MMAAVLGGLALPALNVLGEQSVDRSRFGGLVATRDPTAAAPPADVALSSLAPGSFDGGIPFTIRS